MEILKKYDELGLEVKIETISTFKMGDKTELSRAEIVVKGHDMPYEKLEASTLDKLVEKLEDWLSSDNRRFNNPVEPKEFRFIRFGSGENQEYGYSTIMVSGDVTNEEFMNLYNETIDSVYLTSHRDIAKEMCKRYGFHLVEEDLEIHAQYGSFSRPVSKVRSSRDPISYTVLRTKQGL
ncbi:hypothetical protein [Bacillus toyonensis]|uniref:hypothetical protein n=1 Tax=Bacillus toyonensis TaxID=155322 RepID=UPI000BF54C51|nr:hypothetical protein [Bacillus toyonensis]PGF05275.1 hypothetical protein COM61_02365 [Bacillus toyonensis]